MARALNFFGQELRLARPPSPSSSRRRHSCRFADIKASGRKREESSYRGCVREWKREEEGRRRRDMEREGEKERGNGWRDGDLSLKIQV